jgi:hypothetical protein
VPRTKKPAGMAVDRRNGRRAELSVVAGERFDPPEGISEAAVEAWEAYWRDSASTVQTSADRAVLLRWITEMDRYLRTIGEADANPLTHGSTGQLVENPLYKIAYRALDAAERCERQLGVGALNRSNLGVAVLTEQKSLADMNARYGGGDAPELESVPDDPRVIDA